MSKEEKEIAYEEFKVVIEEEIKKEENNERKYYRHNISLEYLQSCDVPLESAENEQDSEVEKEAEKLMSFVDLISETSLLRALKNLKEEDLKVIELRYRFGLSINEIAIKLQVKDEAAKKKHQRAIKKLKASLEKNK
ncbi:RNA polymerase subunit sigma-24 [Clostridium sp. 19966]|uniref:RNA polymerase sigma factor n=1 Tax=Clostridium sp. 19966 TaxID=2768166 RepID=UPI0028DDC46F|nr:sigma factor-like helix-turn-helix DNA-binding protein [Clostridium sp. 19966]MDT8719605.1 RNA polymerase subunit sigma-24 [Clostridium sp. 19966]